MSDWRDIRLAELPLSVRASDCLYNHIGWATGKGQSGNISADVIDSATDAQLLRIPNFGRKSLNEVRNAIKSIKGSLSLPLDPNLFVEIELHLPTDLHGQLTKAVERNQSSLKSEIIRRLRDSFEGVS